MKIVEPKYEILTDISEGGIKELQQIERVARVCYKSEDKITPDGESAKKLVGFLVKQGHEAMLEQEREALNYGSMLSDHVRQSLQSV